MLARWSQEEKLEKPAEKLTDNEYANIHVWIRNKLGSASRCSNRKCSHTSARFEWALKKGKKHERNIRYYQPMCRPCHVDYDTRWSNRGHISSYSRRQLSVSTRHYNKLRRVAFHKHQPMSTLLEKLITAHL